MGGKMGVGQTPILPHPLPPAQPPGPGMRLPAEFLPCTLRPSRGSKPLLDWGGWWVATSLAQDRATGRVTGAAWGESGPPGSKLGLSPAKLEQTLCSWPGSWIGV